MIALLIDDDPVTNLINRKVLEHTGFFKKIETTGNGMQAIKLLTDYNNRSAHLPDIILLDLKMPTMGGLEFLTALQEFHIDDLHGMRIIIVTSSDNEADFRKAKEMGIENFLQKPVSHDDLMSALVQ